jgi:hypothetical protein
MTPSEELREETLSMMLQDNEMTEAEAIKILDQSQGELFEGRKG